jgi:hypothetical protein
MTMRRLFGFPTTQLLLALVVAGACGCSSTERTSSSGSSKRGRAILECRAPTTHGPIMSAFSLSLAGPVSESKQADLCFYFDSDDCAGGAIVGQHDTKGWLFPIGKHDWEDLQRYQHPPADAVSTEAVTPITKAQEGLCFWVKTVSGRHAIVRLATIQAATYDEIARGKTASVEFEWVWR